MFSLRARIRSRLPSLRTFATSAPSRNNTDGADGVMFRDKLYPFRWLRDSCQCPKCVHPSTRQKLHRTSDVYTAKADENSVRQAVEGLYVSWGTDHTSFYPAEFLERYSSEEKLRLFHRDGRVDPVPWDQRRIKSSPDLFLKYQDLKKWSGLLDALTQLTRFGLVFITGVPPERTSNEDCETRHLARLFSEIRETFYGELWDVINVKNSTNIAYTNLDLGLHMDLLYFENPPRYQLLHCLRNRVQGGTSVFVDALHAANRVQEAHPPYFTTLTNTRVPFHYINAGNHLHYEHPTIQLDDNVSADAKHKPVKYINYSPPFQAPLPVSTPPELYAALKLFSSYLEAPDAKYEYTLREGDAVLFDNRRVLHARTAFSDLPQDKSQKNGTTNRWLKGCYLEADAVQNRRRMLEERRRNLQSKKDRLESLKLG